MRYVSVRWVVPTLLALVLVSPLHADGVLAGTWQGTYTLSIDCEPGRRTPAAGEITITFFGTDRGARGIAILTNVPLETRECVPRTLETIALPVGASVSGTAFSGTLNIAGNGALLSGTVSADRLDLLLLGEDTGTMTLNRVGPALGPSSLTGSYRGTWTLDVDVSDRCTNISHLRMTGELYATVIQEGNVFTATVFAPEAKDLDRNGGTCREAVTGFLSATLMGWLHTGDFEGFLLAAEDGFDLRGSAAGNTITAEGDGEESQLSLTMTRISDEAIRDVSGRYVGTYDATDDHREYCTNFQTLSYWGPIVVLVTQVGPLVFAETVASRVVHSFSSAPWPSPSCTSGYVEPQIAQLGGVLRGTTWTGTLAAPEVVKQGAVLTIDGETIAADIVDGLASWRVRAAKTMDTAPVVVSFEHLRSVRNPGDETTLAWCVYNADAVSIDHGIGAQPLVGSVKVRPTETTTYTITVSGPRGTTQAQRTISVGASSKRRGVRH